MSVPPSGASHIQNLVPERCDETTTTTTFDDNDGSSSGDYGPDFTPEEEQLLHQILDGIAADDTHRAGATETTTARRTRVEISPADDPFPTDIEDLEYVVAAGLLEGKNKSTAAATTTPRQQESGSNRIAEHPDSPEGRERDRRREDERTQEAVDERVESPTNEDGGAIDERSPIERFRRPPRKGLSVTDLVSPAWCELQYWYTLTKFGRKRATPAMTQGRAVHKTLEEQVHTNVPVQVMTREDGWALRIWNVIQGLHTLRTTGMTRELEIWGVIDGEVVTGIIDMLSYECPDEELDADAEQHYAAAAAVKTSGSLSPGAGTGLETGTSLSDFLLSAQGGGRTLSDLGVRTKGRRSADASSAMPPVGERVYLTDVKTRGSKSRSIPSVSSTGFRPTHLQLHLYYHLLTQLATTDDITIDTIASRFNLKPDAPFSDNFIAQVGGLNDESFVDFSSQDSDYAPPSSTAGQQQPQDPLRPGLGQSTADTLSILLEHNTLSSLWSLMKQHLRHTFLLDDSQSPSQTVISPLLTVTYISASEEPIKHLGSRSFFFNPPSLYPYLSDGMQWWHGHRPARGVSLYDAWKCRICEFRDECEWRKEQEERLAHVRAAKAATPDEPLVAQGSENGGASAQFDAADDKATKE